MGAASGTEHILCADVVSPPFDDESFSEQIQHLASCARSLCFCQGFVSEAKGVLPLISYSSLPDSRYVSRPTRFHMETAKSSRAIMLPPRSPECLSGLLAFSSRSLCGESAFSFFAPQMTPPTVTSFLKLVWLADECLTASVGLSY